MLVPKYVQDLLSRSRYEYDVCTKHSEYAAGYTIRIYKATAYTYASTFLSDLARLKAFVERNGGDCYILYAPQKTEHRNQYAVVTIYDPVMHHIERYIQNV